MSRKNCDVQYDVLRTSCYSVLYLIKIELVHVVKKLTNLSLVYCT